jgi:hypothetical protein
MLLCVDADSNPLERDEHCSIAQSGSCDDHCRHFSSQRWQVGYSTMFFGFAPALLFYFATATWLVPETKGKTLEEIESAF